MFLIYFFVKEGLKHGKINDIYFQLLQLSVISVHFENASAWLAQLVRSLIAKTEGPRFNPGLVEG